MKNNLEMAFRTNKIYFTSSTTTYYHLFVVINNSNNNNNNNKVGVRVTAVKNNYSRNFILNYFKKTKPH